MKTKIKLTNSVRKAIYKRDNYRCALCDSPKYIQIHHYIARGRGGGNSKHNLITLCQDCHMNVHGSQPLSDYYITQEETEQAITEYLADMYAPNWLPWEKWEE